MTASAQQSRTFIPVKAGKAPHSYEKHLALIGISLSVKYASVFVWASWLLCRVVTKVGKDKGNKSLNYYWEFHLASFLLYKACEESIYSAIPPCLFYPCCIIVLLSMRTLTAKWNELLCFTESWGTNSPIMLLLVSWYFI